eukprot:scaffold2003_cov157-Amphora_coffeaeformis.AAC.12
MVTLLHTFPSAFDQFVANTNNNNTNSTRYSKPKEEFSSHKKTQLFITLPSDKIETITDVPLLPLLVEADRAWTFSVWLSKPITVRGQSCNMPVDSTVECCSSENLTQQSTTMKLQVYTERCFTTAGLLIASFMYIFLFVSAALYVPLPGAFNDSNVLALLDSHAHVLARRGLRGQIVHANTTDTVKNASAYDLPQRPTVQFFSTPIPNIVKSDGTRSKEVTGVAEPVPALTGTGEESSSQDASSETMTDDDDDDDLELEMYTLFESSLNGRISKSRAGAIGQNTAGPDTAIRLGLVSYVVIAGVILMSFR